MPKKKTALHEVLAVEGDLQKVSSKLCSESIKTLGKENLFKGQIRSLRYFDAAMAESNTDETTILETTVDENIDYLVKPVAAYWDAVLQKDATNQLAVSDLIVNGKTIATNLPATFLLGLEKKLVDLRKVYDAIPTLPPGIKWIPDETAEKAGIFMTAIPTEEFKTKKDIEFKEAAPPTKEHKAQMVQVPIMTNIGKYTTDRMCGMFTPLRKAQCIARVDEVLKGVKQARNRANGQEVVDARVGEVILNFINSGE